MVMNEKKKKYTPINATSAAGINWENYQAELAKQMQYNAANPKSTQAFTQSEKQEKFGSITDPIWNTGVYTKDKEGAMAAGAQWGVNVQQTGYNGDPGYYYVPDVKDQREVQQGASGADEGLMNNQDYAIVQSLKKDFADAQSGYNAAIAAGDADLAAQYQQAMNNAHLDADRIRAGYGYSGGQDGSMYITHGALGANKSGAGNSGSYGSSGSYGGGVSSGGSGGGSGTVTDLSEWIEAMYNAKTEADMAALEAAYKQNMDALNRAEVGVKEAYQDNRNQTAGASELAARNFAEYANAYGLNSGTGGQAELARNVTLQNNLNSINMQESQTLADLDLAKANAETEYNLAIAQAEATGDYAKASALYQEKVRVQEALTQLMMWETEMAFQKQQYADSQAQQQWQNALAMQQYNDALTQQQWENDLKLAQLANKGTAGNGTGSYTPTTGTTPGTTVNPTYEAPASPGAVVDPTYEAPASPGASYNNSGLPSGVVKKLQNYFGLAEDGYWGPNSQSVTGYADAKAALKAYNNANPLPASNNGGSNSAQLKNHLFGSGYDSAYSTIQSMVANRASADEIVAQLNALYNAGNLTSMGVENLLTSFDIGGYRSGQ